MNASDQPADFTRFDDTALLAWRAGARAELERLPPASPGHARLTELYGPAMGHGHRRTYPHSQRTHQNGIWGGVQLRRPIARHHKRRRKTQDLGHGYRHANPDPH